MESDADEVGSVLTEGETEDKLGLKEQVNAMQDAGMSPTIFGSIYLLQHTALHYKLELT